MQALPWADRVMFQAQQPEQKFALVSVLRLLGSYDRGKASDASIAAKPVSELIPPKQGSCDCVVVINFHLDAMGNNEHRFVSHVKNRVFHTVHRAIRSPTAALLSVLAQTYAD